MNYDEDPIIDEIDVFLSKELAKNLFLFQYPVRPSNKPYTDYTHLSARIKPKQKQVELDICIDTKTSCYARSKGQQIALNVDGGDGEEAAIFNSDMMDKQTLLSTDATPTSSRYAIGTMKNGELHLTPVDNIIQLRPSFSYLDRADSRMKKQNDKEAEGDVDLEEVEKEEEAKAIKVQFVRQESDIAKARREASYAYHKQKMSEERWIPAYYIDIDDPRSQREKQGLYCNAVDNEISQLSMKPKEYLSKLIPECKGGDSSKAQMPNNVLSISQLQNMPLIDQVKALLTNAKVLRFSQILQILPGSPDPAFVLKAVQQVARLVQGCWVVKSEVLYPKDTCSPNTGVSSEILCRGRDYLMWRFTQSRCVVRKEIASTIKLLSEDMKDILEQMSRPKINQGWEFCQQCDNEFIKKNPEIVQRHSMIWEALSKQFSKYLKIPEEKKKGKKKDGTEAMEVITGEERIKIARKRSQSLSQSPTKSDQSQPPNPARSHQDKDATENDLKNTNLKDNSNHIAASEHYSTSNSTSNQSGGTIQVDKFKQALRIFLKEHFEEHCVMGFPDIRRYLSIRLMESPAGYILGAAISDEALEETAQEIGASAIDIAWPSDDSSLKRKRLFGMCRSDKDNLEKHRMELLKMFSESFKQKRNTMIEKIKSSAGLAPLSRTETDRLIRSICVSKGHFWYLKGTIPTT